MQKLVWLGGMGLRQKKLHERNTSLWLPRVTEAVPAARSQDRMQTREVSHFGHGVREWKISNMLCWSESESVSCSVVSHRTGCSLPGSSGRGIFQARILEWVTITFSRGLSQARGRTWVSHIAGRFFTAWITSEAEVRWGVAVKVSGKKRRQTLRGKSTVDSWRPALCLPKAQPSSELTSNDSQQSLKKQNSQRSMWEIALVFGRRPWPELPVSGNIWKEAFSLKRKGCHVKPAKGTRRCSWKSEASPASVSITATKRGFIRGLPKWNFETSRDISCKSLRSGLEIQMIISLLGIWDS